MLHGWSAFMPCPDCGASVKRGDDHTCSPDRRADYLYFQSAAGRERLEEDIVKYLDSAVGRFDRWMAAKKVRGE